MVSLKALFQRTPATPPAPSHATGKTDTIAFFWDGGALLPIKSGFFESGGSGSSFGAWSSGLRSYRELDGSDAALAEAYVSCEWAFRALNVRTQKIASVLNQGRYQSASGEVLNSHPLKIAMEEGYRLYRLDVLKSWSFNLGLYGEAYIQIVKAALGLLTMPRALRSLTPLAVEPFYVEGRIDHYDYAADEGYYTLSPQDIVFDSLYNPLDEKRGLSLLAVSLNSINIDRSIVFVTKNYLKNNARPGLIFTPKADSLTPTDWDMLTTELAERAKGPNNAGKPLVMGTPMDITAVQPPSLEDQQFLTEEKKRRICSAIGVPTALVDYTDMAFQLSEEQARNFYDLTVIPAALDIARIINTVLMPQFDRSGAQFVIPVDEVLNGLQDPSDRMNASTSQLAGGYLTMNEARQKHQLPKVDGGDVFFFPSGVVPVPVDQLANAGALIAASKPVPTFGGGMNTPAGMQPPMGNLPSGQPPALPTGSVASGNVAIHSVQFDPTPISPVTVKQSSPADELAAWKRKAVKSGANKPFTCYTLPKHIEAFVRDELSYAAGKSAVAAVFEDALGILDTGAMKDYADTRAAFVAEMLDIIGKGQADETSRQAFAGAMRATLRRYGLQAFQDGIAEGGESDHESFSEDELTIFKAWNAETADYISGLSSELYKEGGITENEIEVRANMWASKSLDDIYYAGYRIGGPGKKATWKIDGAKDHCDSCVSRDGQTKTMDEWGKIGFPRDRRLDCGGWECSCGVFDQNGKEIGFQR